MCSCVRVQFMLTSSEKPLNITACPNLSVLAPAAQIHKINWFDRECGYGSCIAQWQEGDTVYLLKTQTWFQSIMFMKRFNFACSNVQSNQITIM